MIDATETGDLLPLCGAEYVTGFESRAETGEPHAPAQAQPLNMQPVSACFALDHRAGEDHTIERPASYAARKAERREGWPEGQLSFLAPDPRTGAPVARTLQPNASSQEEASRFLAGALELGHEGIMAKALDAAYEAGHRGRRWLKIKPANTLDLVVLAAEWGHGRRHGWLSNLHLGARNPEGGGFVMLGKTFKGMTDAMLAWQTQRLLELEIARDGITVHVRPELVVEVAFNEVQGSTQYPGGVALRFARIKRYRTDKTADQSDTIGTVQQLYTRMTGLEAFG